MTKVQNKAEEHLIVGSLEVIQDVTGAGFDVIKRNIDSLQQGINTVAKKQSDFYKNIADDSVITPTEKVTLKNEWEGIVNEYLAIVALAETKQCSDTNEVRDYVSAYNSLRSYLFTQLHIFDDMSSNTAVSNPTEFNEYYENYYTKLKYAENRCAAGNDYWTLRILDNLNVTGSDNEVALYEGNLYRYSVQDAKWRQVDTSMYYGVKNEFFKANLDDYLLSVTDSVKSVIEINNAGPLVNEQGKQIIFNPGTEKGYIYKLEITGWSKVTNRNDWRYVVAQNDIIAAGLAPSPALQNYVEGKVQDVGLPAYMGPLTEVPASWHKGDWFVWGASDSYSWTYATGKTINLIKGHVYKFNEPTWTDLDPSDSRYNEEFMTALDDLVTLNMGGNAYYTNLFVKKIFAMQAVINELQTKVIELTENGCIKTQGYNKGGTGKGVYIGADGSFECVDGKFNGEGKFEGTITATGFNCKLLPGTAYTLISKTGNQDEWFKVQSVVTGNAKAYTYWKFKIFGTGTIRLQLRIQGKYDNNYSEQNDCLNSFYIYCINGSTKTKVYTIDTDNLPKTSGTFDKTYTLDITIPNNGSYIEIDAIKEYIYSRVVDPEWYYFTNTTITANFKSSAENMLTSFLSEISASQEIVYT